ncbi:MAG: hypothetical protein PHX72_00610 [Candidatus Shapirobacteria bacterium]|nr:hypothetical protein [Candidatus Shapirobacteria bacterium]
MNKDCFFHKGLFLLTISLLTLTFFFVYPGLAGSASNLKNARVVLSDSRPLFEYTKHTNYFQTTTAIPASGKIIIDLDPENSTPFDLGVGHGYADMSLRYSANADMSSATTCTLAAAPDVDVVGVSVNNSDEIITITLAPSGTCAGIAGDQYVEIVIGDGASGGLDDIINPAKVAATGTADTYLIEYETQNAASETLDTASVKAAIIDAVTITAEVKATLSCQVAGVGVGTSLVGVGATFNDYGVAGFTTNADAVSFGVLEANSASQSAQQLKVNTNGANGFYFAVKQYGDLTSDGGDTIDTFVDGVTQDNSSPVIWAPPSASVGSPDTYGHLGYGTTDITLDDLNGSGDEDRFFETKFAGLSTTYEAVLSNDGPSDGISADTNGQTYVVYQIEISGLQQAGIYSNTVSYLCTGRY